MAKPKKTSTEPVITEPAKAVKVRGKKITKADVVKSGFVHGMILVNPTSGDQEVHPISNARDLVTLCRWEVVTEFGSTKAVKMSEVLSKLRNVPTSNDED